MLIRAFEKVLELWVDKGAVEGELAHVWYVKITIENNNAYVNSEN